MSGFILISLFIIIFDLFIVNTVLNNENDQILTYAISFDFVLVIPLLLYFLLFRKKNIPLLSIVPVALLGYLTVWLFVPQTDQQALQVVKYFLLPLLPTIFGFKVYQIVMAYRSRNSMAAHPMETLRKSLEVTIGNSKIASLLTHELSVFYYFLFAWREKPFVRTDSTSFSYHTNSNKLIFLLIFSKILIIEGVCMHILLAQWSHTAAWLLSLGNVYVIILLIADYRAVCLNPILVSKQEIRVQYGIQMYSYMNIDNVDSISVIKFEKLSKDEMKKTTKILDTEPNVHIRLKSEITIITLFGIREQVDQIYLFVDKPHEFQAECQRFMNIQSDDL